MLGKVSVIKSLLLPKLIYIFSVLPTPSGFIALIQTIIYNFLWKGPDKVAPRTIISSFDEGGLNLTDLESSIKSLRLAWISRIFKDNLSPWKNYLKYLLKPFGGQFFFQCNYNINSVFYSEKLQWWSQFRSEFAMETTPFDSIIWNNCKIRIDGSPIYYHNYVKVGLVFVSDLTFHLNNIESFNMAQENGLIGTNFLTWSKHLTNSSEADRNIASGTLKFKRDNEHSDPASSKSKDFYALLIQEKATHFRGFSKLMSDFCLSEDEVSKAFMLINKSVVSETFVQSFQFKIIGVLTISLS